MTIYQHGTLTAYNKNRCRCDECRVAFNEYQRRRRLANPSRTAAEQRRWREAHPDQKHAATLKWNRENPEAMKRIAAKFYARNAKQVVDRVAAWRLANPDKAMLLRQQYRTRKVDAETRLVTRRDWTRLCARYRFACAYCGRTRVALTQDHVIPLSRGGRHAIGNLLPACMSCNASKRSKLVVEWTKRRRVV